MIDARRFEPRSTSIFGLFSNSRDHSGMVQFILTRGNSPKQHLNRLSTGSLGGFSGSHGQVISWYGMPSYYLTFGPGAYIYIISNRNFTYLFDRQREDGMFKLLLNFGESHPNKPPTVKSSLRCSTPTSTPMEKSA